ncbi:MAG: hypothetical protein HKM95_12250 [Inquilinus sp.]|nr:hypothetical protein [Inquilinus sp.]
MRKIVSATVAFAFATALAGPAFAGCFGETHTATAQTTPPVVAQTTIPTPPTTPPADQPNG